MLDKMGLTGIPPFVISPEKARRLSAIAAWINARSEILGIRADLHKVSVSTDRPLPKGLRFRVHTGKGRSGNELRIYAVRALRERTPFGPRRHGAGDLVHRHNAAETYRSNDEVERWLKHFVDDLSPAAKRSVRAVEKLASKK